jgi:phosphoserine phosphatase
MFIATLIAKDALRDGDISDAEQRLRDCGVKPFGRSWIEADRACDILFSASPEPARRALEGYRPGVDVIVQGEAGRRKKLLVADMDSTMITVECLDELADYAGVKAEVAAITERAMAGEIDFAGALAERLKLLEGLEEAALDRCHDDRVRIMPGAKALVRTMRRNGARCLLVSGGFTHFADRVAAEIGFDEAHANRLAIEDGRLLGSAIPPILGAEAKLRTLLDAAGAAGVELDDTMAVGDGANDIPMLQAAGLGIAYRAKPTTAAAAAARIDYNDLTALLYVQGYPREEWAE